YQPSTGDITAMRDADVVVSNGVHLEAMMLDQLRSLGDKHLTVGDTVPADKLLPWPEKDAQGNPLHDPHIWNSPEIWKIVTKEVANRGAHRGRR
ncbi:metal ABC transporter solute-binding protein, Zn/Mn family, partial [Streptomyces sp. P17]|uniref:metal ABC transporter solute-binding protein, Zn/Mn family n=1 Tax=Streptomyces sp. P17 TaxID=3074716 RepID=UPI0028F447FC